MRRTAKKNGISSNGDGTIRDRRTQTDTTSGKNHVAPDQGGLDESELAALIEFFKTLDRWDREAKKC
jgi:hypothetical protein